jgi:hypothetical protein
MKKKNLKITKYGTTSKFLFFALSTLTIIGVLFAVNASANNNPWQQEETGDPVRKSMSVSTLALSKQCGNIFYYEDLTELVSFGTIADITQQTIIPMLGTVAPIFFEDEYIRFYNVDDSQLKFFNRELLLSTMLKNPEMVVIHYNPEELDEETKNKLEKLARDFEGSFMIIPWLKYYGIEQMPLGRNFAFAKIGASQTCMNFDTIVLSEFIRQTNGLTSAPLFPEN